MIELKILFTEVLLTFLKSLLWQIENSWFETQENQNMLSKFDCLAFVDLLLVLFPSLHCHSISGNFLINYDSRRETILPGAIVDSTVVASEENCAILCTTIIGCGGVNFHPQTLLCESLSEATVANETLAPQNGWTHLEIRHISTVSTRGKSAKISIGLPCKYFLVKSDALGETLGDKNSSSVVVVMDMFFHHRRHEIVRHLSFVTSSVHVQCCPIEEQTLSKIRPITPKCFPTLVISTNSLKLPLKLSNCSRDLTLVVQRMACRALERWVNNINVHFRQPQWHP